MSATAINNVFGATLRSYGRPQMPPVPDEIVAIRRAQERDSRYPWTGLNFLHANSADDVRAYLGEERDAARTMVSANVPMFVLRYSYHTGKPMEAWLQEKPRDGKLKLQLTITPSWHAPAPGAYQAKAALTRSLSSANDALPKPSKQDVINAINASASFKATIEQELGSVDQVAGWFLSTYERWVQQNQPDAAEARKFLGELIDEYGKLAMGEKFSKENTYTVRVQLPDGKTITKTFDCAGDEPPKPGRKDKSHHATTSPEIEIDISGMSGKTIVVQGWPGGSAGVGGYREARETRVHIP